TRREPPLGAHHRGTSLGSVYAANTFAAGAWKVCSRTNSRSEIVRALAWESMVSLPLVRLFLDELGEPAQPRELVRRVPLHPGVELQERLGAQRVEPALPLGADRDEARLVQDAQVARHAGLVDVHLRRHLAHRALALAQKLYEPPARRGRERREDFRCHATSILFRVYTRWRMALRGRTQPPAPTNMGSPVPGS